MTPDTNPEIIAQRLIEAVESGAAQELRDLLRHIDAQFIDRTAKKGWPLIFLAKDREILRTLLQFGANPNARGPDNYHMLHFGHSSRIDEVSLLVTHGADVNAETSSGYTPLISATRSGDASLVQYLIDRRANIEHAEDELGMTPLHQAVFIDTGVEIPEILLNAGASPNSRARNGQTPLIYAAFHSLRLVQLLLRFGGDSTIRDDSGMTAADRARCLGREDIARILAHGRAGNTGQGMSPRKET